MCENIVRQEYEDQPNFPMALDKSNGEWTVTFDSDGGTEFTPIKTYSNVDDYDKYISLNDYIPVKEGYYFVGWVDKNNDLLFDRYGGFFYVVGYATQVVIEKERWQLLIDEIWDRNS